MKSFKQFLEGGDPLGDLPYELFFKKLGFSPGLVAEATRWLLTHNASASGVLWDRLTSVWEEHKGDVHDTQRPGEYLNPSLRRAYLEWAADMGYHA